MTKHCELQPGTSTAPLPMRYASMGYTFVGSTSSGYGSIDLLKFLNIDCTVVRNIWKCMYTEKKNVKWIK